MVRPDGVALADLDACAREPIHAPGAIQPHGALLAVDRHGIVRHASQSLAIHLGIEPRSLLGRPASTVLGDDPATLARGHVVPARPLRAITLAQPDGGHLVELLPDPPGAPPDLAALVAALARCRTQGELWQASCDTVRSLTGYRHVMAYLFRPEGHGDVVAESRTREAPSYLGHQFPASDIPPQARAIYRRQWVRIIPDAAYTPSPLEPPGPIDLSAASLRSIAPVHLEYLANMGVRASLSVSLLVRGELVGLLCAHDDRPHPLPFATLEACELAGRLASLRLTELEATRHQERRAATLPARAAVAAALRSPAARRDGQGGLQASVLSALAEAPQELLAACGATGAALLVGDEALAIGACPAPAVVRTLERLLPAGDLASTHEAPRDWAARHPNEVLAAQEAALCGSVLVARLPGEPRRAVLWFRGELAQTVLWAGDPRPRMPEASGRIHPRASFATWSEEVRGAGPRWEDWQLEAAREIQVAVVQRELAQQLEVARAAVQARDDVMAFLSHDLKGPLSTVQLQSDLLRRAELTPQLQRIQGRLQGAVTRMMGMVADALDVARLDAGRLVVEQGPVPVAPLVQGVLAVAEAQAEARGERIEVEVAEGLVMRGDAVRLDRAVANLVGNAIKFASEGGLVRIRATREDGSGGPRIVLRVSDDGPGVPAALRPRLFERFGRDEKSGKPGTGLGLFIVRGIAAAHGGEAWAEHPERGATFALAIPAWQAQPQ